MSVLSGNQRAHPRHGHGPARRDLEPLLGRLGRLRRGQPLPHVRPEEDADQGVRRLQRVQARSRIGEVGRVSALRVL